MARRHKVDEIHLEVTDVIPFANDVTTGFTIRWASDIGWGEYTIYKFNDTDVDRYMVNGKYVNTYNNLRYVQILNTPINSYEMVTQGKNLQEYHFTGVDWEATENDFQYCSVFEEDFNANTQYYKYD